jgi:hypothetical protein
MCSYEFWELDFGIAKFSISSKYNQRLIRCESSDISDILGIGSKSHCNTK